MRFTPKTLIIIDLIVLAAMVVTLFFGDRIGDALHPTPNRALYKSATIQADAIYGVNSSETERAARIEQLNQLVITESEALFGVKLNGQPDSLVGFDRAINNLSQGQRWVYADDRTMLKVYLGEVIRKNAPAEWTLDDTVDIALKSTVNDEIVDLYWFVENKLYDQSGDATQFYQDSVTKLGEKQ